MEFLAGPQCLRFGIGFRGLLTNFQSDQQPYSKTYFKNLWNDYLCHFYYLSPSPKDMISSEGHEQHLH